VENLNIRLNDGLYRSKKDEKPVQKGKKEKKDRE